jgi:hypothetical protein
VIVAHHLGEGLLVTAAVSGATTVPLLALAARARLRALVRYLKEMRDGGQ